VNVSQKSLLFFVINSFFFPFPNKMNACSFPPDSFLVGDTSFDLSPWLLTPYVNPFPFNLEQDLFNEYHNESRMVIDKLFLELKCRWKELMFEISEVPQSATDVILTCATLHNICQKFKDSFVYGLEVRDQLLLNINRVEPDKIYGVNYKETDQPLLEWRNEICRNMSKSNFPLDMRFTKSVKEKTKSMKKKK